MLIEYRTLIKYILCRIERHKRCNWADVTDADLPTVIFAGGTAFAA
jgi:hypothetical protein